MAEELKAPLPVTTPDTSTIEVWTVELKDRYVEYIDKWRKVLCMDGWHVNVKFSESPYVEDGKEDTTCMAHMYVNESYLSGHTLTVYPHMLASSEPLQERAIIHELVHIITEPQKRLCHRLMGDKLVTWQELANENERATDWVANIVYNLHTSKS